MVNKSSIVSEAIKGIITSMMDRVMSKALVSGKKLRVIKKASFDDTLITWPNQLLCPLKETV